jgi:sortase, SrtB family
MTKRKRKKGSFSSALLLGLIFGVILVLGQELAYQHKLLSQYDSNGMQGAIVSVIPPSDTPEPTESAIPTVEPPDATDEMPAESEDPVQTGAIAGYTYSEGSDEVAITLRDDSDPIMVNFAAFKGTNADFVGMMTIPGVVDLLPVVHGSDNSFYLDHIFNKSYSTVGTLFVDFRNSLLQDENTIVYGHNFHNQGGMFSKLVNYAKQDYYDAHPTIYYLTETGGYAIEIFSAYEASTSDLVYNLTFSTEADYSASLEHIKSMSAVNTGVEVTAMDNIMTLSTCSDIDYNGRFVVVGKVTPLSNNW